jgi:putative intracellular protease/amidase
MKKVLVPLPSYGFDPTESAVPWSALRRAGHTLVFATPKGSVAAADTRMVTGEGLPFLLRSSLMAQAGAVTRYRELEESPEFRAPIAYASIDPGSFDALLLPGGHDKGMREYLEDAGLQAAVARFFEEGKTVAAICHGTLLAARSRSGERSALWGRKTTGLTRRQELVAWWLTRATLGDYYRTYETPMADELVSNLRAPGDYDPGPGYPIPLARDSDANTRAGFTVRDGNYLSARWPGDAHRFAKELAGMLGAERAGTNVG